jgi:hypothetical protein
LFSAVFDFLWVSLAAANFIQTTLELQIRQLVARDLSSFEAIPFCCSPFTASLEKEDHGKAMTHRFRNLHRTNQPAERIQHRQ